MKTPWKLCLLPVTHTHAVAVVSDSICLDKQFTKWAISARLLPNGPFVFIHLFIHTKLCEKILIFNIGIIHTSIIVWKTEIYLTFTSLTRVETKSCFQWKMQSSPFNQFELI